MEPHPAATRFAPFGTTIFTEISALAQRHNAINLGQGFPDFDGPEFLKQAVASALGLNPSSHTSTANQYARMAGVPALAKALAADWSTRTRKSIDWESQVTVTSGCTEALAAAMLGLINPGDEVILFEPFYDSYRACVAMAGGIARVVTLRPHSSISPTITSTPITTFAFDPEQLAAAFTNKTRVILLNTPHNPTGKAFTHDELALIARLCLKHNVTAITDEVYEHLVYDPTSPHLQLATFDGMADRTLTLSSLGKSFSFTGWKVGWAIGSAALNRALRSAHQFLTFSTCTPMQTAAAAAIGSAQGQAAINDLVAMLRTNREFLTRELTALGFNVIPAAGAYFLMADWTNPACLAGRLQSATSDAHVCRLLIEQAGVAAIPASAFYQHPHEGQRFIRFAFCKRNDTLQQAVARLQSWAAHTTAPAPTLAGHKA